MKSSDDAKTAAEFQLEEERVEQRSTVFKKELGLTDLALTQILFIVGLPWIGVAAKQGPSHVVLWLLAIILFYFPSAVVVMYLNRIMPLEGGLYQWAKLGFNETIGFLVAWNVADGDLEYIGNRASGDAICAIRHGPRRRVAHRQQVVQRRR